MKPSFEDYFSGAPAQLDVQEIHRLWSSLAPGYDINRWRLPLPPWAQRPFDNTGMEAWEILEHDLASSPVDRPVCVYIHIPFCSSKCGFCDSYSFKLGSQIDQQRGSYVDRLIDELEMWAGQGNLSRRPVSTVHLGGGTPTYLGANQLARLVEHCRRNLQISAETEWALESTVEALDAEMIAAMHAMGFRRLHLGVQSLESKVRQAIGRRCEPEIVLEKIAATRALGWVVSVDMICGLPYQSLAGLLADLETLISAGVNGFSLYELLIYPQNRRWADRYGLVNRDHIDNFLLFLAGAQLLSKRGYHKNMFNHWADDLDQNIYFTFPTREEDCLALGTIADGVFGDYHYRHPRYAAYLKTCGAGFPGLQGGLRRTQVEQSLHHLTIALLSGSLTSPQAQDVDGALLERWLSAGLLEEKQGSFWLTDSGSWFAGNLVAELSGQIPTSVFTEG